MLFGPPSPTLDRTNMTSRTRLAAQDEQDRTRPAGHISLMIEPTNSTNNGNFDFNIHVRVLFLIRKILNACLTHSLSGPLHKSIGLSIPHALVCVNITLYLECVMIAMKVSHREDNIKGRTKRYQG